MTIRDYLTKTVIPALEEYGIWAQISPRECDVYLLIGIDKPEAAKEPLRTARFSVMGIPADKALLVYPKNDVGFIAPDGGFNPYDYFAKHSAARAEIPGIDEQLVEYQYH